MANNEERSLTLLETEQGLQEALAMLDDPETPQELLCAAQSIVDGWLTGAMEKRDGYAAVHFRLRSEIEFCDAYVERVRAKKESLQRQLQRLHDRALYVMEHTGQLKLEGRVHTLTARKTKGKTLILDETAIPEKYVREEVVRKVDKSAVRADLDAGISIPGADAEMPGLTLVVK